MSQRTRRMYVKDLRPGDLIVGPPDVGGHPRRPLRLSHVEPCDEGIILHDADWPDTFGMAESLHTIVQIVDTERRWSPTS